MADQAGAATSASQPAQRGESRGRGRGRGRGKGRGRGRGGQDGGAGRGRGDQPAPAAASSKLPAAAPAPKADNDDAQSAAGSDADAEVCFICANPVVHYAVAPCNHKTCHICALRMRALYKTKDCAHCRVSIPSPYTAPGAS